MVTIENYSGLYKLTSNQLIDAPLDKVWDYFSNPVNLQSLTPSDLSFEIQSLPRGSMKEGDIISYKIQIFPFIKTNWVTEIKSVELLRCFVDEQRYGPYKMWHHRHTFIAKGEKTEMIDEVHFKLPFGLVSSILYLPYIKPKLLGIFNYRFERVNEIFKLK
ncbi:MAG: SRPBCC family protein [Crocinitomicaceae bacterium]|nr:SRPBCC family protein [Crocinitomicaceae bacterium]